MTIPLQAFFAESDNPTHITRAEVQEAMAPLMALATRVQKQLIEYQAQIAAFELDPESDDALAGKAEHIRQTIGAAQREAAAFFDDGRALARTLAQWDRYIATAKSDVAQFEAAKAAGRVVDGK